MTINYKTIFLFMALGLTIWACSSADTSLLYGDWRGDDWLIEGKSSGLNARSVNFEFEPDGTYTATMNSQKEAGTYRVRGDKLYTIAEGKKEKVVQLLTLTQDTVKMNMNRSGRAEVLVLVKK